MAKTLPRMDTQAFERVMAHLPVDGEPSLVVLKAHLLVEEQLWALIYARLGMNEDLLARFKKRFQSSADIALIAEALVSEEDVAFHEAHWLWKAIEKLNSVRNRLAHDLEPVGVEDKMADLVSCVSTSQERTSDLRIDFYMAAFQICQSLESLHRPVDATDYQDAF